MDVLTSINPATDIKIANYEVYSDQQVDRILEDCNTCFEEWKYSSISFRTKRLKELSLLLKRKKNELAHMITNEMGKVLKESIAEIEKCSLVCEYYAEEAQDFLHRDNIFTKARESYISFRPLGTILGVMPWNFPFWQAFRFAVPTLTAGNVIVLKHASNVSGCALAIEKLFKEAGFPDNAFRVLLIPSSKVNRVIESSLIQAVTLTGSTEAGKAVAKKSGEELKKIVLELGGSDAYLILKDADIESSVEACLKGRIINAGQSCIAAKRLIVVEEVYNTFLSTFCEKAKKIKIGNPLETDTDIGPLAKKNLREKLHEQVKRNVLEGAKCLMGGEILEGEGNFYPLTILTGITESMPANKEEIFGPVVAIMKAKNTKDAVRIANSSSFGLGAAVFTSDIEKGKELAEYELDAGCVFVNDYVRSDPKLPFGGIKNSGFGRELSYIGIQEFVNQKTVYIK